MTTPITSAGTEAKGAEAGSHLQSESFITRDVRKTILPNGLTLLTKELHDKPVVATMIWYRVGSRNEELGQTGKAHWPGGQDREERSAVLGDCLKFRHFFASLKMRLAILLSSVKRNFSSLIAANHMNQIATELMQLIVQNGRRQRGREGLRLIPETTIDRRIVRRRQGR